MTERKPVRISIIHLAQDDPRKNTALRLAERGLASIVKRPPRGSVLLDPEAPVALSPADRPLLAAAGLVAVDCSWEKVADATRPFRKGLERRSLPFLVAANPVKFGTPFLLTTAEALAATLLIAGFEAQARALLAPFSWGARFFEVNAEPLAEYAACATSEAVVAAQRAFV